MTTTQRIHNELSALPLEAQDMVLAYIEWLKYKALVSEVEHLAVALRGEQDYSEEIEFHQLIQQGHPLEIVREKLQVVQRALEVLGRIKKGDPGIPQATLKQQARAWRNK